MLDVSRFELAEALSLAVDRRYRDPMPLGDLGRPRSSARTHGAEKKDEPRCSHE